MSTTGANKEPLKFGRKFGSQDDNDETRRSIKQERRSRSRSPLERVNSNKENQPRNDKVIKEERSNDAVQVRETKKRSRWSTTKAFVPGMPTILPSDMDDTQRQIYIMQIEIEEATRKLRMNEFSTNGGERSPSPEPIYDMKGKRTNIREVRKRHELEHRRHDQIQKLLKIHPEYKPPADYRPPNTKLYEKIFIPQADHPEINFVGLLIGPRGATLKALEETTGAKIIIRGQGSVKEGKLLRRDGSLPGSNEPLHVFINGSDPEIVKNASDKIKAVIEEARNTPEENNMLRQQQLRQLALLNGTLRMEDIMGGMKCTNCGSDQHKTYECTESLNLTANIVCSSCGGAGHIAKDCLNPRSGFQADTENEMESEYAAFLNEIQGEKKPQISSNDSTNATLKKKYPLFWAKLATNCAFFKQPRE